MARPVIGKRALARLGKAQAASAQAVLDKQVLKGEKELRRRIRALEVGAAKKVMAPATRDYMKVTAKHMRREIPSRFKNARKGIGWRFRKGRQHQKVTAKVGVHVGKKMNKLDGIQEQVSTNRRGRGGVGIGARNIHWLILGTGARFRRDGSPTGSMPATMPNFASRVAASSKSESKVAMLRRARIELRKLGAGTMS